MIGEANLNPREGEGDFIEHQKVKWGFWVHCITLGLHTILLHYNTVQLPTVIFFNDHTCDLACVALKIIKIFKMDC